jgi:antitoxin component of MazEF toxin-antitoxin module
MRALQKLVKNGNSTQVTIPRTMLITLGWITGESVMLELLEDGSLRLRRPVERDFAPVGAPRLVFPDTPAGGR